MPALDTPDDTIAALATPPGWGALAVIRLSGPGAIAVADAGFSGRRALADLDGFQGAHGHVRGTSGPVDEVVAWVYRGPRSYTGEDMVEISCHGGAVPARRVLAALYEAGARPAGPGEFTRRAFLNGRLDLAQAEAVADLISARGSRAQEQALAQLEGGLSRRVRAGAATLRGVLVEIEAHLDFGDDVPTVSAAPELAERLRTVQEDLSRLAGSHASAERVRDGIVVALTGRPNAGKSSLLNALLGTDRAIVHEAPGTTRDVVDAQVEWDGIPVRLVDTAGLRTAGHAVEEEGIERSRREMLRADRVLWVVDVTGPPETPEPEIASALQAGRAHIVLNKQDLVRNGHDAAWAEGYRPRGVHRTSALTGSGVAALARNLREELTEDLAAALDGETAWVANERHARLLAEAAGALVRAREVLGSGAPLELGAADLHQSLGALGAITGDDAGAELLDEIFKRFCIGK